MDEKSDKRQVVQDADNNHLRFKPIFYMGFMIISCRVVESSSLVLPCCGNCPKGWAAWDRTTHNPISSTKTMEWLRMWKKYKWSKITQWPCCVQVRHPGVTALMQRDFVLMRRAAILCSKMPGLRDLRLEESVQQFGGPLKEQLDLSSEAESLARFNNNFKYWRNIKFPAPVYPSSGTWRSCWDFPTRETDF